jgi:hypothetical protein
MLGTRSVATRARAAAVICCAGLATLAACSSGSPASSGTTTSTSSSSSTSSTTKAAATTIPLVPTTVPVSQIKFSTTTDQAVNMPSTDLDLSALPLGSGKYSTSAKSGYLDACGFPSGTGGAVTGSWIDTSAKTWNLNTKPASEGKVYFHSEFSAAHEGDSEVLTGNGLPPVAGKFPVTSSDPTDKYGGDPNSVFEHHIKVTIPYNPKIASKATCVMGMSGIAVNGVPILDGFNETDYDADAAEIQDVCHGHPNPSAGYHYHGLSPCLLSAYARTHTTQVGWALDGFGIYVEYNSKGQLLTDADLDACHGRTSVVPWHGKMVRIYHYDMTIDFPYTVGCFRGTVASASDILGLKYPGAPY